MNRKLRKLEVLEVAPPPPPREPTKEEIKALKKRDHQILNALKVLIQPIMDQIQRKYRKFRTPVIPQHLIQYLYDEKDPNYVRSNVAQFRPYELEKDKDGIMGLRETASGKFFYNLETTTIEERLSNGFYARPKDFVADIRSLAKDAKNIGDKDRALKANEMLANVEVDLDVIAANPAMADCENVYQRQLQRAKERAEKIRKRAENDDSLAFLVESDIPVQGQNIASVDDGSGPIILGEAIPRSHPLSHATTFAAPGSQSNGYAAGSLHSRRPMSNGSSVPSRVSGEDVQMGGTDDGSTPQHTPINSQAMPPPISSQWPRLSRVQSNPSSMPTGVNTQGSQISQRSAFQQIPHDLSPTALINDASTTSSGKKTTDPSTGDTQRSNGKLPSFFSPLDRGEDVHLPDTQRDESQRSQEAGTSSSQEQWLHSQAHGLARGQLQHVYHSQTPSSGSQSNSVPLGVDEARARPPHKPSSAPLDAILNAEPSSSQPSSQKDVIVDDDSIDRLLFTFTTKSSGCSIEQLEQINRELMDTLWKYRGEYNRTKVAVELQKVFNEVIIDIEAMQKVLKASQEEDE